jgi:hypothetical protein
VVQGSTRSARRPRHAPWLQVALGALGWLQAARAPRSQTPT